MIRVFTGLLLALTITGHPESSVMVDLSIAAVSLALILWGISSKNFRNFLISMEH